MRIPTHHDDRNHADSAMTPMIDVVFLLLIFLLCAATGQIQESLLPTDLAAGAMSDFAVEREPPPFGEVWLFLKQTPNGRTTVQVNKGGETYNDFGQLQAQLNQLAAAVAEAPVILDIEPQVPLDDMIKVYDASRAAGFESINFAIDRQETNNPKQK